MVYTRSSHVRTQSSHPWLTSLLCVSLQNNDALSRCQICKRGMKSILVLRVGIEPTSLDCTCVDTVAQPTYIRRSTIELSEDYLDCFMRLSRGCEAHMPSTWPVRFSLFVGCFVSGIGVCLGRVGCHWLAHLSETTACRHIFIVDSDHGRRSDILAIKRVVLTLHQKPKSHKMAPYSISPPSWSRTSIVVHVSKILCPVRCYNDALLYR